MIRYYKCNLLQFLHRFRVTHVDPKTRSSYQKELLPVPPEGANKINTTHSDDCEMPNSPTKLNEKEVCKNIMQIVHFNNQCVNLPFSKLIET